MKKNSVQKTRKFNGHRFALACAQKGISKREAESLKENLKKKGFKAVRTVKTSGGKYRVYKRRTRVKAKG